MDHQEEYEIQELFDMLEKDESWEPDEEQRKYIVSMLPDQISFVL